MQLSTLFSRAWQQKYLTPAERALYKFFVAIIVLVPSGLLLSGVDVALTYLHTSLPSLLWQVLAVLVPALLMALAKLATARGDTAVGNLLLQIEQGAEQDIARQSVVTKAYTPPKPITMPSDQTPPNPSA